MFKVIGLVGRKKSGKTTAYNILGENYEVNEVMIAQPLKNFLSSLFQIPLEYFNDQNLKDKPWKHPIPLQSSHITAICLDLGIGDRKIIYQQIKKHEGVMITSARSAMQYVGTDVIRKLNPNIHIERAMASLKVDKINVVTDIRFFNEFDPFFDGSRFEFLPIHIHRPNNPSDEHESEKYIEEIGKKCVPIINDKSPEDFRKKLEPIVYGFFLNDHSANKVSQGK